MEEQIEVMRQALGLIDTVVEGLTYIVKQLDEGLTSDAVQLIGDVNLAITSINNSLQPILTELDSTRITLEQIEEVKKSLEQVTLAFEVQNYGQARQMIEVELIPLFNNLNGLLRKIFQPFFVS